MKKLDWILLAIFLLIVAFLSTIVLKIRGEDVLDFGLITHTNGIEIASCHTGDAVKIKVEPVHPDTNRLGGWFTTTNSILTLSDLSMIPNGTNLMEIRTMCDLATSGVVKVRFVILREPPKPRVGRWIMQPDMSPPSPWTPQPLPGGTNESYAEFVKRQESGKRRGE